MLRQPKPKVLLPGVYGLPLHASESALNFLLSCVEFNRLLAPLLLCCFLTTVLVFNIQLKQVLTKEPPVHNPFKLVYGVVA